jgi:hypothetical protein
MTVCTKPQLSVITRQVYTRAELETRAGLKRICSVKQVMVRGKMIEREALQSELSKRSKVSDSLNRSQK